MDDIYNLPSEVEEGNIEYKRNILNLTPEKITKYGTQMSWRINEGRDSTGFNEAYYYIGIEDNGKISRLNTNQIKESLDNFKIITDQYDIDIASTRLITTKKGVVAIVKVVKLSNRIIQNDIRVALLGGSNNGKTTFMSVITRDILDNGDGSGRRSVLRYDHEKEYGETSSIKYELIGFSDESIRNYESGFLGSWENIVENSDTLINLIDFPGNTKYIRTTLFGLLSHKIDLLFIFISLPNIYNKETGKFNIDQETLFYMKLCKMLNLHYYLIFTKSDVVNPDEEELICFFQKTTGYTINIVNTTKKLSIFERNGIIISNKTGYGIDILKKLLSAFSLKDKIQADECGEQVHFMINDVIFVPDIGTIVSGTLLSGRITIGDKLLIGPINKTFREITIKSIHKKQIPNKNIYAGEIASIMVDVDGNVNVTKYLTIFSPELLEKFINKFQILIRESEIKLKVEMKLMIFVDNIIDHVVVDYIGYANFKTSKGDILVDVYFSNDSEQFLVHDREVVLKYNKQIATGYIQLD